jgi:hypothetical protein
MKDKYLRYTIYFVGLICLYAFFAVRIFPLMNSVLSEKMDKETRDFNKYGDLYYYNCITHFRQDFPPPLRKYRLSEKNPAVNDADVLTFGDSFFDFSFQTTFPERLSDTLSQRVYSFVTQDPAQSNPFCILNNADYPKNSKPKYAIVETIERNIPVKFSTAYDLGCSNNTPERSLYDEIHNMVFKKNSEKIYALILKRGYVINHIYSFFATLRFDLCGYISPLTSKYKLEKEPWLFYEKEYSQEPGGFYYHYTDEELNAYADNILLLSRQLKSNFNLDLIFMPIPNKYTLYHTMINKDRYNDFLPELYAELDKRQVHYINLYHEFTSSPDTLYYGTDTHWKKEGVDKALQLVLEKMNRTNSLAYMKGEGN